MSTPNPLRQQKIRELVLQNGPVGVYQMVLNGVIKTFPNGFWSMPECYDYGRACTKYLIENILGWDVETICAELKTDTFIEYKLRGMLNTLYGASIYEAFNDAYPDLIKPWDLRKAPKGYWNLETMAQAVYWLYTEKYAWNRQFVTDTYSVDFLNQEGLGIINVSEYTLFDILNYAFPNEFRPWELRRVPMNFWTDETCAEAVRWLYTEKYPWDRQFVIDTYCQKFLVEEGLGPILKQDYSIYTVLNQAFPNEFRPWELSAVPNGFWTEENKIQAIRWLYTEKYEWNHQFVVDTYCQQFLKDNGLSTLTTHNIFILLTLAFPNEFTPDEFPYVARYTNY